IALFKILPRKTVRQRRGMGQNTEDTWFIRFLSRFFGASGTLVVNHAWKMLVLSSILSLICTIKIPLTEMANNMADFTPSDAPSFAEWRKSQEFFEDDIQANNVYAFVTAKDGGT
ncbi:hypothetical protein PMAYCL1PPCAC_30615, partial [Pristionchus mayeri]